MSQQQATSATTATFTTSLTVNLITAGVQLAIFVVARCFIRAIYEPRTYIPPKDLQAPVLGRHPLKPLWRIIRADSRDILEKNGVDPYVFVRFCHLMAKALIPIWFLSWTILLPLNSVGQRPTVTNSNGENGGGLTQFTSGNIDGYHTSRYWAHLVLDYVFVGWIIYLIWREMEHWLVIRQKFLINPYHSKSPQANTVLIQGIPPDLLDEDKLGKLFAHLPGGVKRIWLNRNLKELPKLLDRQQKASIRLENAQVRLIKFAAKYKHQREHKIEKFEEKRKPVPDKLKAPINADMLAPYKPTNPQLSPSSSQEGRERSDSQSEEGHPTFISPEDLGRADQLVPRNKRPTFRLKPDWAPFSLGWMGIGKKVDTIDWCRNEIAETAAGLAAGRTQLRADIVSIGTEEDVYPPLNSAFIYFHQQIAAHMAEQVLLHHKPYRMSTAYIEQSPENVVWFNLNLGAYQLQLRWVISLAITAGLTIAWAFPIAVIGALASTEQLVAQFGFLSFLLGPGFGYTLLRGVISGILPPVLLALINMLLPTILRQIITYQGIPTKKGVELILTTRYFVFLVFNTFVVIVVSTSTLRSIGDILNDPISIPAVLANKLPNTSIFYITLILTQFTGSVGNLLQPISLVFYFLRVILGGGTPRSVFNSRYRLQRTGWGQQVPAVTVYAVIMLAYMVISPIIIGFGALFFLVTGLIFKYLFIWVYDQPPHEDTGGLFFPKAITHVFVGLYIQQIALCAFFFLLRDADYNAAAIPQGALMVVLIVITAAVHYTLIVSYKPLISALPLSLAHMSHGMPKSGEHASFDTPLENSGSPTPTGSTPMGVNPPRLPSSGILRDPSPMAQVDARLTNANNGRPTFAASLREPASRGRSRHRQDDNSDNETEYLAEERRPSNPSEVAAGLVDVRAGDFPEFLDPSLAPVHRNDTPAVPTAPGPPRSRASSRRPSKPASVSSAAVESHEMADMAPFEPVPSPHGSASPRDIQATAGANDKDGRRSSTMGEDDNPFFAVPGGPGVLPRHFASPDDEDTFLHPAGKQPQRTIWLPRDDLGLCLAEIEKNRECGVNSSCKHAVLIKGKVRISGRPPDDI